MQRMGSSAQGGWPQLGEDPDWSLLAQGERGLWLRALLTLASGPAADGRVALKAVPMALSSTHSRVAELGC